MSDAINSAAAVLALANSKSRIATRKDSAEIQPLLDRLETLMNSETPINDIKIIAKGPMRDIGRKGWTASASRGGFVISNVNGKIQTMFVPGGAIAYRPGDEFVVAYSTKAKRRLDASTKRFHKMMLKINGKLKGGAK